MFNIEEFRKYVDSQIVNIYTTKTSLTREEAIDLVCSGETLDRNTRKKLNNMFDYNIINKPRCVNHKNWFLYEIGYKKCSKCQEILKIENFYNSNNNWSSLKSACKICSVKHGQKSEVKQHKREYMKEYQQRPKVKKRIEEYMKEYRQNPEKIQKEKEYKKEYNQRINVKAKKALYNSRRRAKYKEDLAKLTKQERTEVEDIYYCAQQISLILGESFEVDHILAISKGGTTHPDNLQILTEFDNCSKGDRPNSVKYINWYCYE